MGDMARSSTTFRPKWRLGTTTVIRVPEKLAPEVLRYAHELDDKCKPAEIYDGPTAYRTAEDVEFHQPVNVAQANLRPPLATPRPRFPIFQHGPYATAFIFSAS